MICRHSKNDPACSSHKDYIDPYESSGTDSIRTNSNIKTPDSKNFNIIEVEEYDPFLVLKVQYPNCKKCSYEGEKILVIKARLIDAIKWKKIDPHFVEPPKEGSVKDPLSSPGPIARFPASIEGWIDAVEYAKLKADKLSRKPTGFNPFSNNMK